MNCLPLSELESFSQSLVEGLKTELFLTPKPGLVDLLDNGSHQDLDPALMLRSIALLDDYLVELSQALDQQQAFSRLRQIGIAAEQRMLQELSTNCHRGGIFLTGLLLSAFAHCCSSDPSVLSVAVAEQAAEFFQKSDSIASHGQAVRDRMQCGGIVGEALRGLPSLFKVALPAIESCGDDFESGAWLAMSRLMRCCEDTTTLHRGGETGLARLKRAGAELESCLLAGDDPEPLLHQLNTEFISKNLTMGGVADLLGVTFGYARFVQLGRQELLPAAPGAHSVG